MLTLLLAIFVAGGLGALARYGIAGWVQEKAGATFPWGTFAVNIVGSFVFGIVFAAATERGLIGPFARIVILTGFLGALTTFSTFMFETTELMKESAWLPALGNFLGQGAAGIVAIVTGMALGRLI